MSNSYKAGSVAQVFGVQLRNKFLWEQFCFCCILTAVRFIQISVFAFQTFNYGVCDIFYVCVSDGAERLPPFQPRRGWDTMFHGPAFPGVPESAIRRTHPS
jgi:hypothetical protein